MQRGGFLFEKEIFYLKKRFVPDPETRIVPSLFPGRACHRMDMASRENPEKGD